MPDDTSPLPISLEVLRKLISDTDVLNSAEKQYWLDLLPSMNENQKVKLKSILETQQKNMEDINKEYDRKLEQVTKKTLSRWDSEKAKSARLKRRKEEKTHEEEAQKKAEELLKNW